ncbi:MAG: prolyl oligopeptidase family serine peptidase [Myxococcota bacterium]
MPKTPTITQLISLPAPTGGRVSPDGHRVAYTLKRPNWRQNRYEAHVFIYDTRTQQTHQLTRHGSVSQLAWLGEETLAVLREAFEGPDDRGKQQVWLFEGLVGEGWPVTDHETNVWSFQPFAEGFLYKAAHPARRTNTPRTERFGTFRHQERETSAHALYYVSLPRLRDYLAACDQASTEAASKQLQRPVVDLSAIFSEPRTLRRFEGSSTGNTIYLTCRVRDDLVFDDDPECYELRLDPEAALEAQLRLDAEPNSNGDEPTVDHLGTLTRIALPPGSTLGPLSPDGLKIVVERRLRDRYWYTQPDLFTFDIADAQLDSDDLANRLVQLTHGLDQDPLEACWCNAGVVVWVLEGTRAGFYVLGPDAPPRRLDLGQTIPGPGFHANHQGHFCFVGSDPDHLDEVYTLALEDGTATPLKVTALNEQVEPFEWGTVETIQWTSRDGTPIEGVLRKPPGFEAGKQYPLAFVVHGGPASANREWLLEGVDRRYYPSVELASRGVLVLKPNYRGSLGRGQSFVELNAGNLGVGDLWDLESAVDALVERGMVDRDRVGCMGWSQGGYISAMAGLRSDRFTAVSVGAGISDWYTYRVSNDVPQFTDHYLGANPYENRAIYEKTSPISGLSTDAPPMLIQHGEKDRRVPFSNAADER